MSFNTSFEAVAYQSVSDESLIIGTCMLPTLSVFGTVMSADLTRVGDTREIKDCRNRLRAFLIENAGFELSFETMFDSSIQPGEMGDTLVFPLVGVTGIILPGTQVKWSNSGERMLSMKAKSWDHMSTSGLTWTYDDETGLFLNPD